MYKAKWFFSSYKIAYMTRYKYCNLLLSIGLENMCNSQNNLMLILTYNHIICFLVPFRICFLFPKNLSDNFIFLHVINAFLMLVSTFSFSPISLSCLYRYHPKKYKLPFLFHAASRKKVRLKGLGITSPLYNKISTVGALKPSFTWPWDYMILTALNGLFS